MLGMLVSGGVSGGHLNPAVTVAVASVGKFPWRKVSWCQKLPSPHLDPAGAALPGRAVPGRAAGQLHGVPGVLGRAGLLRARQVGGGSGQGCGQGCGQGVQQLCRGGYRTTPDTAAIFSTYPAPHLTLAGGIIDQVTLTLTIIIIIVLRPARWW